MKLRAFAVALVIAFAGSAASQAAEAPKTVLASVAPKAACATLKNAPLSAKVGAAVRIRSAESKSIDGGQYCAVAGEIDRHIQFEVRLPTQGWSQRYVQLGCGGLCGVLNVHLEHAEDCRPANDHSLVLASTDMGHVSHGMGDGSFGAEPDARIDFAYRGVHLTSVAAQALIEAYYGQKARYRYFSGCSDGGREALIEAQRFPEDFDGIAAGAPAMNFQVQNTFYHAWMYRSNHRPDGSAILTANKLPALHAAALASCDEADGLKDGLISDPRLCHFDPKDAQCRAGVAPTDACLTSEEVAVARKFYEGPRDTEGHRFTIGGPQVGSERLRTALRAGLRDQFECVARDPQIPRLRSRRCEI
jgi:Tannase and feruloyl esterase